MNVASRICELALRVILFSAGENRKKKKYPLFLSDYYNKINYYTKIILQLYK